MELDFFRAEHDALLDLRQLLLASLDGSPDPVFAASLLKTMNRILVSHVEKEDAHLYPHLKRDRETALVAERFERELGGLATAWRTLMSEWPENRIALDWRGFGADTRPVMFLLAERARREEEELYPLLERWRAAA